MSTVRHSGSSARLRRFAALACLFSFLIQLHGVLPCLLTAVACWDGSHGVSVQCDHAGLALRLTHNPESDNLPGTAPDPVRCRQHGPVADALCLLATESGNEPDHVLHFAAGAVTEERDRSTVTKRATVKSQSVPTSACKLAATSLATRFIGQFPTAPSPAHQWLASHRSVCLVI